VRPRVPFVGPEVAEYSQSKAGGPMARWSFMVSVLQRGTEGMASVTGGEETTQVALRVHGERGNQRPSGKWRRRQLKAATAASTWLEERDDQATGPCTTRPGG
jgi:hypothetical protein